MYQWRPFSTLLLRPELILILPHCWITGSPRVPGDEEEEDTDDLEKEFNIEMDKQGKHHVTEEMLHGHVTYDGTYDHDLPHHMMHQQPQYPLLTNGQSVSQPLVLFLITSSKPCNQNPRPSCTPCWCWSPLMKKKTPCAIICAVRLIHFLIFCLHHKSGIIYLDEF